MHQPGANHTPRASVTQVNHSVHTLSTFLRIRADLSMQIFFIIIIIVIIIKSEADDRIDSTVCVNHVIGDNVEQIKTTGKRDGTVRCTKINYHRATEIGYPENEKHYNDGCSHLKHVSVIVIVIMLQYETLECCPHYE